MTLTIGILLFDGVEELDFAGPWEVLGSAVADRDGDRVVTIAEHSRTIRCAKGLRVLPDHTLDDAPPLDVLLVPGGRGTRREIENRSLLDWIAGVAETCRWVTSVCTGSFLLVAAGPARAKRVTTHWASVERLRAGGEASVVEGVRFVRDGNLVTASGVSAGIDMALWLVGQLYDSDYARHVQRRIEYYPEPPYADEI